MTKSNDASGRRDGIKAGQWTAFSGCVVALLGIIIPLVMMSIPSFFPCHGECGIGWAGVGFAIYWTPVFVIAGIAVFIVGVLAMLKAKKHRGEDSGGSPDLNR